MMTNFEIFEKCKDSFMSKYMMYRKLENVVQDKYCVFATDAKSLLAIDAYVVPEYYIQNLEYVQCPFDFCANDYELVANIKLIDIKTCLDNIPNIPEMEFDDSGVKNCEECNGEGNVEWEYTAKDGETYYEYHECPVCHGEGEVGNEVEVPTGRMIKDDRYYVVIPNVDDYTLKSDMIQKLYDVMTCDIDNPFTDVNVYRLKRYMFLFVLSNHIKILFSGNTNTEENKTVHYSKFVKL